MGKLDKQDPFGYEDDIQEGVVATVVLGEVSSIINEQRQIIISRMISLYRSGNTEHDLLVGAVAELKALDDFVKNCESTKNRAYIAKERMHNAQI